jgi:hypothetical protein
MTAGFENSEKVKEPAREPSVLVRVWEITKTDGSPIVKNS